MIKTGVFGPANTSLAAYVFDTSIGQTFLSPIGSLS